MSKTANPFSFDFTRLMSEFKSPLNMPQMPQMPMMDVEQIMSIQRRNFEALTSANQLAVEGLQAFHRRQAEIVRETLEDASSILSDLTAAGTPEDKMVRQIERLKQSYEVAVSNARELAELASKSNGEAAEVVASRISDSLDEIKSVTKKATSRKAA